LEKSVKKKGRPKKVSIKAESFGQVSQHITCQVSLELPVLVLLALSQTKSDQTLKNKPWKKA
jgi:hypothetical protein